MLKSHWDLFILNKFSNKSGRVLLLQKKLQERDRAVQGCLLLVEGGCYLGGFFTFSV